MITLLHSLDFHKLDLAGLMEVAECMYPINHQQKEKKSKANQKNQKKKTTKTTSL